MPGLNFPFVYAAVQAGALGLCGNGKFTLASHHSVKGNRLSPDHKGEDE